MLPGIRMHAPMGMCPHAYTHKYVKLNAFPWKQWFCEHALMLCHLYITSGWMMGQLPYVCAKFKHNTECYKHKRLCLTEALLGTFAKLQKVTVSFVVSVCLSAWNSLAPPTGRILMKLDIWAFFENLSWKFNFHENPVRIMSTLHKDVLTFMTISC
jgi:hypothetical protein